MERMKHIRRFFALLLALAMCAGYVPAQASEPAEAQSETFTATAAEPSDVWDAIDAFEEEAFASMPALMGSEERTEEDFALLSGQVEQLVTVRDDYVEDSLQHSGEAFFWRTTDGEINGYLPYERELYYAGTEADVASEAYVDGVELTDLSAGELVELMTTTATNRDVAVINPWKDFYVPEKGEDEFFDDSCYDLAKVIAAATGGNAYHLVGVDATIDAVGQALSSCGVVIVYTHGNTDFGYGSYSATLTDQTSRVNCSYITLRTDVGITDLDRTDGTDGEFRGGRYPHTFKSARNRQCVDGFVLKNHMPTPAPNSLVFFYSCLVMSTDKTIGPLMENGVHTTVGFSQPVYTPCADAFIDYFFFCLRSGDTAGHAFAEMKARYGYDWDVSEPKYEEKYNWHITPERRELIYSYEYAIEHHYAFPVLASPEYPYPGRGKVDCVLTPESSWTLPSTRRQNAAGEYLRRFAFEDRKETRVWLANGNAASYDQTVELVDVKPGTGFTVSKALNSELKADLRNGAKYKKGDTPVRCFEGLWHRTLQDGTTETYRLTFLILDKNREIEKMTRDESIPFGKEKSLALDVERGSGVDFFSIDLIRGVQPKGMSLLFDGKSTPKLTGTPAMPNQYQPVYRILLTDGREIELTMNITVKPKSEVTTSQNITIYADGESKTCKLNCGAYSNTIIDIEPIGGGVPGMHLKGSMDQQPCLVGIPTQAGEFDVSFRICLRSGTVCTHQVHVLVYRNADPLEQYTIDCSLDTVVLSERAHLANVMPSLNAAAAVGQIKMEEVDELTGEHGTTGSTGLWTLLDLDKDGSYDISIERRLEGYCYNTLKSVSLRDDLLLRLNDKALEKLQHDASATPYAKSILFCCYREWDLTVDGVKVTSLNRKNILGNGKFLFDGVGTLSVYGSYKAAKATDKPLISAGMSLTLRNVGYKTELEAKQAVVSTTEDLKLIGSGMTVRSTQSDAVILRGSGGKTPQFTIEVAGDLTVKGTHAVRGTTGNEKLLISGMSGRLWGSTAAVANLGSIEFKGCAISLPFYAEVEDGTIKSGGAAATEVVIDKADAIYDLMIAGRRVTSANRADVLGDGVFSYDPDAKSLWVMKSGEYHDPRPLVVNSIQGLYVRTPVGKVTLSNEGTVFELKEYAMFSSVDMEIVSQNDTAVAAKRDGLYISYSTLRVQGKNGLLGAAHEVRLGVDLSNVEVVAEQAAVADFSWIYITGTATELTKPADAVWEDGTIRESGGEAAKEVQITAYKTYGLLIGGKYSLVSVAENNRDDILGDGVFRFDGEHTLTITAPDEPYEVNAEFIVWNQSVKELEIVFENDCTFIGNYWKGIVSSGNTKVTGPGKLTFAGTACDTAIQGDRGELTLDSLDLTLKAREGVSVGYCDLIIDHSAVDADCSFMAFSAYEGSIVLRDSVVVEPEEYSLSGGSLLDGSTHSSAMKVRVVPCYEYPLIIDGVTVTELNAADILGNGVFSFDGVRTLTVDGEYTNTGNDIINSAISHLIIDFKPGSKLTACSVGVANCVHLFDDATLTGGPVSLDACASWAFALCVEEDATATLDHLTMDAVASWGTVVGSSALMPTNLLIRSSNLDISTTGDFYAVAYFRGWVTLEDCVVDEPAGGAIKDLYGQKYSVDAEDKMAARIVIRALTEGASAPDGDGGIDYDVDLPDNGRRARILVARFDGDGRYLGADYQEITQSGHVVGTVDVEPGADQYRLFFIDEENVPIHEGMTAE